MANDLTTNPVKVDTAGAGALLTQKLYIQSVRWIIPAGGAGGNLATITDINDKVVWRGVNSATTFFDQAEQLDRKTPVQGLKVPTLTIGELYITFKHKPPYG